MRKGLRPSLDDIGVHGARYSPKSRRDDTLLTAGFNPREGTAPCPQSRRDDPLLTAGFNPRRATAPCPQSRRDDTLLTAGFNLWRGQALSGTRSCRDDTACGRPEVSSLRDWRQGAVSLRGLKPAVNRGSSLRDWRVRPFDPDFSEGTHDSMIQKFNDSIIQEFNDSRIQKFNDYVDDKKF
jgi:hypothetical protein